MIWLRCQADERIGLGHAVRCVRLADHLRAAGVPAGLITERLEDAFFAAHAGRGLPMARPAPGLSFVEESAGWPDGALFVLDVAHPATRHGVAALVRQARRAGRRVAALDGLGADALFEPTALTITPYLLPEGEPDRPAKIWVHGPAYAILPAEYSEPPPPVGDPVRDSILVAISGSDPWRLTETVLRVVGRRDARGDGRVVVVAGPYFGNERTLSLREACEDAPADLVVAPTSLRDLLQSARAVITGPGLIKYEAAACETPSIIIAPEPEHIAYNRPFHGRLGTVIGPKVANGLDDALAQALTWTDTCRTPAACWTARSCVDGQGLERVVGAIIGALKD